MKTKSTFNKIDSHVKILRFLCSLFSVKKIFFFIFLTSLYGDFLCQATLPTSRTSWDHTAHPVGWTHTSTSRRATATACSGNDGLLFDASNDRFVLFFDSDPDVLSFKLKKSTMSGNSFVRVESSQDGTTYTAIGTYGTAATPAATAITDCATININLACGDRYVRFTYTKAVGNLDFDDLSITKNAPGLCGSNTIVLDAVNGASFDVTCSSDDAGTIDFTSTGTFTVGNIYTAQLSDNAGNFGSPLDIGTLSSVANTGSINVTIPYSLNTSANYKIRIISSAPNVIGTASSTFTINLSGGPCVPKKPFITSVMLDGCNPTCTEGRTEVVFANTGGVSINTNNSSNIDLDYTSNGAQELLLFFKDGSALTTALNTAAGCAGTFVDGRNMIIPANSKLMFLSEAFCPLQYNTWSNYCGTGPIYVLYGQDGASSTTDGWITGGNFSNSNASNFDLVAVGTDGITYRTRYNYSVANTTFGEGNYVVYNNDYAFQNTEYPTETTYRTPAIAGALSSCAIIVLPLDYKSFEIESKNNAAYLVWSTYTERNNDYFEVEIADVNGLDFVSTGRVDGNGSSSTENHYSFLVENMKEGYYYFRLKQVDYNGDFSYSEIKSVTIAGDELAILKINKYLDKISLNFNKNISQGSKIEVFEITGKQIYSQEVSVTSKKIEINENLKGMLLIKVSNPIKGIQTFRVLLGDM
jgi:hypothetical protein